MVIPMYKRSPVMCVFPHCYVVCCCLHVKHIVYKQLCFHKYLTLLFIVRFIAVYMYITFFTNILTLDCMLGYQSLGVCEASNPYF